MKITAVLNDKVTGKCGASFLPWARVGGRGGRYKWMWMVLGGRMTEKGMASSCHLPRPDPMVQASCSVAGRGGKSRAGQGRVRTIVSQVMRI